MDMLRALMTPETARALARINAEFYSRHAQLFALGGDNVGIAFVGQRRAALGERDEPENGEPLQAERPRSLESDDTLSH